MSAGSGSKQEKLESSQATSPLSSLVMLGKRAAQPAELSSSGGQHSAGGERPVAPLGLEWPPLPQTTASMPRSGGSHPVTSLPQALARLRGDDSEEARRIREAETLVKRGNQIEIRKLCTTDAGWGVSRWVSGKKELTTIANHVLTLSRLLQACMHLHHDTRPGLWHAAFGFGAGFGARARGAWRARNECWQSCVVSAAVSLSV